MLAFSDAGLQGLTDRFHPFAQSRLPAPSHSPRPVHFNTWEAAYFDFDEGRLRTLADAAADLGVERFVLDDGWFLGRSHDQAGLGDWTVDPDRFPHGLQPLIDHVQSLGLSFGLWVEPEMVNPDSALYPAHPDWVLAAQDAPRPTMRHQLILDLANPAVRTHLRQTLGSLLKAHPGIAYLKWDYNRAAFPAESGGIPGTHARTAAFWTLLDELRAEAPGLEIESCASGGGRIDLGVLARTTRVWASDQTDAIERLRIQRWTSLVVPLAAMGSHVGPSPNPITGRRLSMAFRARIALFGHMGVEADPSRMSDADVAVLKAHIALYKRFRDLLHTGRLVQWSGDDPGIEGRLVVSQDGGEALALLARTNMAAAAVGHPLRLPGLVAEASYRLTLPEPWPTLAARKLADPQNWREGRVLNGALLAEVGIALPLIDPETAWLVHLTRVG
jgi:alpha-galactosidase